MPRLTQTFGLYSAILAVSLFTLTACSNKDSSASSSPEKAQKAAAKQESLQHEADAAIDDFRATDPGMQDFLNRAQGYAVFPSVGKGGFIVGGAHGKGIVYEQGRAIGEADLTQASVGFLAGGQTFREIIVFGTPEALDKFKNGQLALTGDVSVVALKAGAAGQAQFKSGIAVFVKPIGGAMFDVSVAGQKFTFKPMR